MNSGSAWFARSSGMNTGAIATVSTRAVRTAPATIARRWRLKRRHASP